MALPEHRSDTKARLLDAAEKLFSEHGFAPTSLRAITAEAGANLAAVNYHFGSKESLVRAVFDRRLGPLNAERVRLLEDCLREAGEGAPDLDRVLRAMVLPWARAVEASSASGVPFVRLLGRAHFEPDPALREVLVESFREVSLRFIGALERCLPQLGALEVRSRFFFAVGAFTVVADLPMFSRFASVDAVADGATVDLARLVEHMIAFLRAGFRADAVDADPSGVES